MCLLIGMCTCVQCSWRPEGGNRYLETGVTGSHELPAGDCWELNAGPQQGQPVSLAGQHLLQPLSTFIHSKL